MPACNFIWNLFVASNPHKHLVDFAQMVLQTGPHESHTARELRGHLCSHCVLINNSYHFYELVLLLSQFLKKMYFFHLTNRFTEKERQKQKVFCPLVHSPNGYNGQSRVDPKLGARSLEPLLGLPSGAARS